MHSKYYFFPLTFFVAVFLFIFCFLILFFHFIYYNLNFNIYIYILLSTFIYLFSLFKAALVSYDTSQPRGQIGAAAAGLHHSHNNSHARFKPHMWPTPQLTECQILNPLRRARDPTHILTDTSQALHRCSTMATTPLFYFFFFLI